MDLILQVFSHWDNDIPAIASSQGDFVEILPHGEGGAEQALRFQPLC